MNPADEFLRHAADCQQMAKFTRDPASRATWQRMAERWRHCHAKIPTNIGANSIGDFRVLVASLRCRQSATAGTAIAEC